MASGHKLIIAGHADGNPAGCWAAIPGSLSP